MEQMTVHQLFLELMSLVNKGQGNKKVILADDSEGNGFHGCFYSITSDPITVKETIANSNGLVESNEEDPNNLIIIG